MGETRCGRCDGLNLHLFYMKYKGRVNLINPRTTLAMQRYGSKSQKRRLREAVSTKCSWGCKRWSWDGFIHYQPFHTI